MEYTEANRKQVASTAEIHVEKASFTEETYAIDMMDCISGKSLKSVDIKDFAYKLQGGEVVSYSNCNASALPALLCRKRMWFTKICTPIASSNGNNAKLGNDDSSTYGCSYFF